MHSLLSLWRSTRRFALGVALPAIALSAVACGDDGTDTSGAGANGSTTGQTTSSSASGAGGDGTGGMGTGGMGTGGMTPGEYPAGPYGSDVGDTLAFLEFEGYVSPTSGNLGAYEDFTMLDIQNSGSPFVLIHLAAMF